MRQLVVSTGFSSQNWGKEKTKRKGERGRESRVAAPVIYDLIEMAVVIHYRLHYDLLSCSVEDLKECILLIIHQYI